MVQRRPRPRSDVILPTNKQTGLLGKRKPIADSSEKLVRASKRVRKALLPYQAPESITSLLQSKTTNQNGVKKTTAATATTKTKPINSNSKKIKKAIKKSPTKKTNQKHQKIVKAPSKTSAKSISSQPKKVDKPTKPKKPGKNQLNPKPTLTEYTKDPTYESNIPIPYISTLAQSRLLIRAVLTQDVKLLQSLIKEKSKISSLCIPRCLSVNKDAFAYAVENNFKPGIKTLLSIPTSLQLGSPPSLILEPEITGHGSRSMFGHGLKAVSVGRGGKEGNAAFLKDSQHYSNDYYDKHLTLSENTIANCLSVGVPYETLEYILSFRKDTEYGKWSLALSSIYAAVRGGHHHLAGKLIELAIKKGGFGFNELHKEALVLTTENFTVIKSVSVVKKAMENERITPLHCAAINPNPKYLIALLNARPDYNVLDSGNWTLIHYAAVCRSDENLKLLLSRGISPMQIEKEGGNTPLHLAIKANRLQCVLALLEYEKNDTTGVDDELGVKESLLTKFNKEGLMPLHLAAMMGNTEIIGSLLDAGADINKGTKAQFDKLTPIMIAANCGHLEAVKYFVGRGAKLEVKDRRGRTVVMNAVINGQAHVVSYLLRLGVNEKIKDSSGNGLTHYAAAYGWYFILKLVLDAGCDPNEANTWKMTPMAVAFLKDHIGMVEILLKEPGVYINVAVDDETGMNILHETCAYTPGSELISKLKFLINQGADPNGTDYEGNNACYYIVQSDSSRLTANKRDYRNSKEQKAKYEALEFLVQKGCDPSHVNSKSTSALTLALKEGNFSMAQKLLELNCFVHATANEYGETILHCIAPHLKNREAILWYKKCAQNPTNLQNLRALAQMKNMAGLTALQSALKIHHSTDFQKTDNEDEDHTLPRRITDKDPLEEYVTFLVETLHSDVNVVTSYDYKNTTVHLATLCVHNGTKILPILLKGGADINVVNGEGRTPLSLAVAKYCTDMAKLLIKRGANVNITCKKENNLPLLLVDAMKQRKTFCLTPLFVSKGGDFKTANEKDGNTVLHYIASKPDLTAAKEAIQSVLEKGIEVNQPNKNGMTPLHLAMNAREREIDSTYEVEDILITAGADLKKTDNVGRIPLHYVFVKSGKPEDTSALDPIELCMMVVTSMKEKIPNGHELIGKKDNFGMTPLHLAARRGATICCSFLLTEKSDILNEKDSNGNSPFALSVLNGHEGCALYFQQHGANFLQMVNFNKEKTTQEKHESLAWEPIRMQAEENALGEKDAKSYSILQAVMEKDWQGIVFLMIGALKNKGLGIGPGIYAAIKANRLKLASKLMERVKTQEELKLDDNENGETLFHALCQVNPTSEEQIGLQKQIFHALLSKGVDFNQRDKSNTHPLIYAVQEHNMKFCDEIFDFLSTRGMDLESVSADIYGRDPFTALFWRMDISTDFKEVTTWAETVLNEGHNANRSCKYPVMICGEYLDANVILKSKKSKFFDSQYHVKMPPLVVSVVHGNYKVVKWLLTMGKNRVDVNAKDQNGTTALMHAVRRNDLKMVRLLFNPRGYDPDKDKFLWDDKASKQPVIKSTLNLKLQDKNGWTVMDHVVCPSKNVNFYFTNFQPIFHQLVNAGASVNEISGDGISPLDRAIKLKRFPIVDEMKKLCKNSEPTTNNIDFTQETIKNKIIPQKQLERIDSSLYKQHAQQLVNELVAEKMNSETAKIKVQPDSLLDMPADNCIVVMDEEQNIPFDCVMTKIDIGYGMYGLYNFYKMQLVKQPRGKELVILFTQWGRVGETGQFQKTPCDCVEEGIKEFKKIFKAKSGNNWESFKSFNPIPRKYRLVNKEIRNVKNMKQISVNYSKIREADDNIPSNMDNNVKSLMKTLVLAHDPDYSRKNSDHVFVKGRGRISYMRRNQNFELDAVNLPFGRLTTDTLKKGEQLLLDIAGKIREKEEIERAVSSENQNVQLQTSLLEAIVELSEEFYALVPVYGYQAERLTPMFTLDDVREKQNMIYGLIQLEFAKELILAAQANVTSLNPFDYVYRCLRCSLSQLTEDGLEDKEECQLILRYINNTKCKDLFSVQGIYKIQMDEENPLNNSNRWLLWHGTKAVNLLSVLNHGLQVTPLGAKLSGSLFGKGIYFADMFAKSDGYCAPTRSGDKFMFLCEVALGKIRDVNLDTALNSGAVLLPKGFHSLKTCDAAYRTDPRLTMDWKGCTVPLGQRTARPRKENQDHYYLQFNEYIVTDEKQVNIRYLVHYKDKN